MCPTCWKILCAAAVAVVIAYRCGVRAGEKKQTAY